MYLWHGRGAAQRCERCITRPHGLTEVSCCLQKGAADDWRAVHEWVDGSGAVAFDALEREFGGASVWVTDTARHVLSY